MPLLLISSSKGNAILCWLVLQTKRARDFQRMADKENQEQNGRGPRYKGPNGSGQWVSMGELGDGGDLDEALGSLGGGMTSDSAAMFIQ